MKLAWLNTLLLVSLAFNARAKEEEELHHFQDLDTGRQVSGRNGTIEGVQGVIQNIAADPVGQLMLGIGNLLGVINNVDLGNPIDLNAINNKITNLNNVDLQTAAAGVGGVAAAGIGSLYALSGIKAALLSLLLKPLDVANFVLAIIGLALLIVWLVVNEGDITSLFPGTGTAFRREDDYSHYYNYDSYSNYVSSARSLLDTPFMQRVTNAVHDAIFKYD